MLKLKLLFPLLAALALFPTASRAQQPIVGQPCGAPGVSAIATNGQPVQCQGNPLVWTVPEGGGGTPANPSSANLVDPTQAANGGVQADGIIAADGSSVNGQPTFSSTNTNCGTHQGTSDVGKIAVVSTTAGAYPFGTTVFTVLNCSSNSWTFSVNATQTVAGTLNWSIGHDANSAGGQQLTNSWNTAISNSKALALPCGVMIVTTPVFIPASGMDFAANRLDVHGPGRNMCSTFVLHPNITATLLVNGGTIFYEAGSGVAVKTGSLALPGIAGSPMISDLFITSLEGALPGTAGKSFQLINTLGSVDNVTIQGMGLTAGFLTGAKWSTGEGRANLLNFQTFTGAATNLVLVDMSGQGTNGMTNSILAFAGAASGIGFQCSSTSNCSLANDYLTGINVAVKSNGATNITVTGSTFGGGSIYLWDNNNATVFTIFGNFMNSGNNLANQPGIRLDNASTILDISGTTINTATAGYCYSGAGIINERAGNTYTGCAGAVGFTQFTGKINYIGGGSMVNTPPPTATNFDTNIASTNLIPLVFSTTPMGVYVNTRQITAGTTCGAGTNTATPQIQYTSPGGTVQTINPTVLSISANGVVDTGATAAQEFVFTAKIGTAVTYQVTGVLASAGCTIKPQYAFDIKSGTN